MCVWRIDASEAPTDAPTESPSRFPTEDPTHSPSRFPTEYPTRLPTEFPTFNPTRFPTEEPTHSPSREPTEEPTRSPSRYPTSYPTRAPSQYPTSYPTRAPSVTPTRSPTLAPTHGAAPGCDADEVDALYLGCYNDRNNNRVLPEGVGGGRHTAEECRDECRGYKYFGREFLGQCFCGDDDDYHKHRAARGCNCCGGNVGSRKICVWEA